jgi:hypothetical protein
MWPGGLHPHVSAIVLDDGRRVEADEAIWRLDIGAATFSVWMDGQNASVEVHRCSQCSADELSTDRDTTTRRLLLALPD